MARPPAGPIGNSPRDVRDDAIGVPAEDVNAPAPPRWPPKPKKVTTNTFHAKVSGGTLPKRADRKPHFRRGGFVSGFASGGSVASKMEKREEKPGEDKNDPFAKQNLKRGGVAGKKVGGDVTGAFSTKDQEKYGTSTFRGGKYENEPTVVKERTKGFNQPMGQDASEDVAAEKRTRGTHYKKGGKT
jgi:hypothetical protein